jgi:hypothetical protein
VLARCHAASRGAPCDPYAAHQGPERAEPNGKPAFVAPAASISFVPALTRDQYGHAAFLIHTAYGRRTPGRYHTILSG